MDKDELRILGYKIALEWLILFVFFGIGILSYVKGYMLKHFFGLISFIKLSREKTQLELLEHEFFKITYSIENQEEMGYALLTDHINLIAIDVIKTELRYVRMILKANINFLIHTKKGMSVNYFCERVLTELNDERDLFRNILRKKGYHSKFIKHVSDATFIYYKFAFKGILLAKKELSLFAAMSRILDIYLITFITYKTTILRKIEQAYNANINEIKTNNEVFDDKRNP